MYVFSLFSIDRKSLLAVHYKREDRRNSKGGSMEKAYAIVTAVGSDRIGIVEDVSCIVAERGCNIEESKMAVLGGEFAVIMLISGTAEEISRVEQEIVGFHEALKLHVFFKQTRKPEPIPEERSYFLKAVSEDNPGIVYAVTSVLKKHSANIEDLETLIAPAPLTGIPLFQMKARIVLPSALSTFALRQDLMDLEARQKLEIDLKPLPPVLSE